jgi:hypothetical protein
MVQFRKIAMLFFPIDILHYVHLYILCLFTNFGFFVASCDKNLLPHLINGSGSMVVMENKH